MSEEAKTCECVGCLEMYEALRLCEPFVLRAIEVAPPTDGMYAEEGIRRMMLVLDAVRASLAKSEERKVCQQKPMKKSEWVSVNERMPKVGQQVDLWVHSEDPDLIAFYCAPYCSSNRGRLTDMRWTYKGVFMHIGGLTRQLSSAITVTHWMPLPEPPINKKPQP